MLVLVKSGNDRQCFFDRFSDICDGDIYGILVNAKVELPDLN